MQVDKLLGPGNQYVTAAKMLLQNSEAMVSIDMPAGPSEVLVIADKQAFPAFVAADLLSQAEHGPDSQVRVCLLPLLQEETIRWHMQRLGLCVSRGQCPVLQPVCSPSAACPQAPIEAIWDLPISRKWEPVSREMQGKVSVESGMWHRNGEACVDMCQVVLVALPGVDIGKIEGEVQKQCDALPRNEVARQALSHSCIVMAASKVPLILFL